MSLARYAAKRDDNERGIITVLRRTGCRVEQSGKFDLIVQRGNETFLLEVKSPSGRFTALQTRLRAAGWIVHVVRTPEDALRAVGLGG